MAASPQVDPLVKQILMLIINKNTSYLFCDFVYLKTYICIFGSILHQKML